MKNIFKSVFLTIVLVGCSAPTKNVAQSSTTTTTSPTSTSTTSTTTMVTVPVITPSTEPEITTTTLTVPATTTPAEPEIITTPEVQEVVDPLSVAYAEAVPNRWRNRFPLELQIIPGGTSRCCPGGIMLVSEIHLNGPRSRLIFTLAHEFGHKIAPYYTITAYVGESSRWPIEFDNEQWADCVAVAFTNIRSYGICNRSDLLAIAQQFVSNPPTRIGI